MPLARVLLWDVKLHNLQKPLDTTSSPADIVLAISRIHCSSTVSNCGTCFYVSVGCPAALIFFRFSSKYCSLRHYGMERKNGSGRVCYSALCIRYSYVLRSQPSIVESRWHKSDGLKKCSYHSTQTKCNAGMRLHKSVYNRWDLCLTMHHRSLLTVHTTRLAAVGILHQLLQPVPLC